MEHKYIDADALRAEIDKRFYNFPAMVKDMKHMVEEMPAADVEPVRHGDWIKLDAHSGMEQYKCSLCQSLVYVPECMGEPLYNCCPVCGCKMGGNADVPNR